MKMSKADKKKYDIHYVECCKEHDSVSYKSLHKLAEAQFQEIKKLKEDTDNLLVRLGDCVEQVVLNNNSFSY